MYLLLILKTLKEKEFEFVIPNFEKTFLETKIVFNKKVTTLKAATIDIQVKENDALFTQADGEIIGSGGFKATIIPKAFSFYS